MKGSILRMICLAAFILSLISFVGINSIGASIPARAVLVLPDHLISAEASGFSLDEENNKLYFTYSSADQSDLDFLFAMSSCWGLFPSKMYRADGIEDCDIYQMIALDTDYEARVLYSEKEKSIMVYADADAYVPSDDQIQQTRSMLMKDIQVPDNGDGKNALPQFYACVGRDPYWNGRIGAVEHIFEGKTCWAEWYDHIEKVKILDYVYCMILFGYDVHADDKSGDTILLHFSNGDAETIVQYNSVIQSANIYYKPGVSYNLLDGDDLGGLFGRLRGVCS